MIQLYSYTCGNKINNNNERRQFFRKIYLSHFIRNGWKGLRKGYVWEVSWRLNKTVTYWPQVPPSLAAILSRSARLLNRGPWGPSPRLRAGFHCLELQQLTPNSKLTRTSCGTGLYNCLTSTYFSECRIWTQLNPSTVKGIPWYLRLDAPVIYTGAFLIWQLGRVRGQYFTVAYLGRWAGAYFGQLCCLIRRSVWMCFGSGGIWSKPSDTDSGKLASMLRALKPGFLEP